MQAYGDYTKMKSYSASQGYMYHGEEVKGNNLNVL